MRHTRIILGCILALGVGLFALGGVGHNDEVSYFAEAESLPGQASVNIQNTGGFRRYFGLVGLRRYGPPFELYIDFQIPSGASSVVLRDLEVLDGNRTVFAVDRADLPVSIVTVLSGGERTHEELASYHPVETFALSTEAATVKGSLAYEAADGIVEVRFSQQFKRNHEHGFFTGL